VRAAVSNGADGVIAKPFSAGKLEAELQRALARRGRSGTAGAAPAPPHK
jgi:DNA-binding response OmpR family regulator